MWGPAGTEWPVPPPADVPWPAPTPPEYLLRAGFPPFPATRHMTLRPTSQLLSPWALPPSPLPPTISGSILLRGLHSGGLSRRRVSPCLSGAHCSAAPVEIRRSLIRARRLWSSFLTYPSISFGLHGESPPSTPVTTLQPDRRASYATLVNIHAPQIPPNPSPSPRPWQRKPVPPP